MGNSFGQPTEDAAQNDDLEAVNANLLEENEEGGADNEEQQQVNGNAGNDQQAICTQIYEAAWICYLYFFVPAVDAIDIAPAEVNEAAQQELPNYIQSLDAIPEGFRIGIAARNELEPMQHIIKQKNELKAYVESILKSGRDGRKDLITILVATFLVGIFSTIVTALLADHLPFEWKVVAIMCFCLSLMIFCAASMVELHTIYEPSLADSQKAHATLVSAMNLARNDLLIADTAPMAIGEERRLKLLDDYCRNIVEPLPIGQSKTISFTQLVCVIVILVITVIHQAIRPPPSSGQSPSFM